MSYRLRKLSPSYIRQALFLPSLSEALASLTIDDLSAVGSEIDAASLHKCSRSNALCCTVRQCNQCNVKQWALSLQQRDGAISSFIDWPVFFPIENYLELSQSRGIARLTLELYLVHFDQSGDSASDSLMKTAVAGSLVIRQPIRSVAQASLNKSIALDLCLNSL